MHRYIVTVAALSLFWVALLGCDDDGGNDALGTVCSSAEQCYPDLNAEDIVGTIVCLDRVENGYCTHHCDEDSDCCAVAGECPANKPVVCAPFESSSGKYCFLSCDDVENADDYCQTYAHPDFICRSTGGGVENRKVCVP